MTPIPFSGAEREWAAHGAELLPAIEAVMSSGRWLQGEEVEGFERALAQRVGREHAVAVGSGTDALAFSLIGQGIGRGDEVIVPDLSFVASASAILRAGAAPVWADVDGEGMIALDDSLVSDRSAAVMAVALYGRPLDHGLAEDFAARHGLTLIEDAAQALGARGRHGRAAGSVGHVSCLSFDPTKPLAAPGSGGALLTNDAGLAARARALRYHGKDAGAFATLGFNSQLPSAAGAALLVKLGHEPAWRARRQEIAAAYEGALAAVGGLTLPGPVSGGEHAFSKYVVRIPARDAVRDALKEARVPTRVHYPVALHAEPVFADHPPAGGPPARAAELTRTVLSLPMHPFLSDDEVERVGAAVGEAAPAWA